MSRKPWIRLSALVTVLALCLSLPYLFDVFTLASALDKPYGYSEHNLSLGSSEREDTDPTSTPNSQDDDRSGFNEGGSASSGTNEGPDGLEEEGAGPEPTLSLGTSGLTRSSRSIPGYNVFEVGSYAELVQALSTTSYPSKEYPETSVYILLTEDVDIERGFTLHPSIKKVAIDGDKQHTLAEINTEITSVSNKTVEVKLLDLTIIGNQWYGLFHNSLGTDVSYLYERVTYTGPQLLHAVNSTAHFTDCHIRITAAASIAHEVAEIRDVYIHGNNQFLHDSPHSVFYLYANGSLVLSPDAELHINALGANSYILYTQYALSTLRLEDGASLHIEGTSSQLAGSAGLHSIYLGDRASFNWEAHRTGGDYVVVNADGGAKDALYLSQGAEFRIAPSGTVSERLIWVSSGNVVVGEGAEFILQADSYTATTAPFALDGGGALSIGNSATMFMQVKNSGIITYGLVSFRGTGGSFTIDRDATVVLRVNRAASAVYFLGSNSSMEITDPNYLEIATTNGNPFHFSTASPTNTSTLTYTDVQQLNYWYNRISNAATYLDGGNPIQRWVSETGGLTINATISGNGNGGLATQLTDGQLDPDWNGTLRAYDFRWGSARILSAGKIGMEVSSEGFDYQGRITVPNMAVPYSQGKVQLMAERTGKDWPISQLSPATPDFHVRQLQAVAPNDVVLVCVEYGYIFHNNPPAISSGTLSLTAPERIEFGVVPIAVSDTEVPAVEPYSLQVQDGRGAGNGWQVLASFSGFASEGKLLNGTLVVNNVPLQETPQQIAAATGSDTIPINAGLLVPGGAAGAGTYSGNITWTLVDAP